MPCLKKKTAAFRVNQNQGPDFVLGEGGQGLFPVHSGSDTLAGGISRANCPRRLVSEPETHLKFREAPTSALT